MHYWWLVAAARDLVRDDLPEGWGLLLPHGPRTLRVVVPAVLNPEPEPMPHALQGALLRAVASTEARLAQEDLATQRGAS
jgi:hypothetical protein